MSSDPGMAPPGPTSSPRAFGRVLRRVFLWLMLAGVVAALGFAAWGYWVETWPPMVRRALVTLPAPELAGKRVRLALASDIHVGNHGMSPARLDRVVDQIMAEHPDAIMLAGDFVNGEKPGDQAVHIEMLTAPLSRLHAPLGVFAVLGNHDGDTDPEGVTAALQQAGITVLRNEVAKAGPLVLAGYDRYTRHRKHPKSLFKLARAVGGPIIAVEHAPNLGRKLPPDVPVLLAGHTHCGQVNLPGLSSSHSFIDGRSLYDPVFRCGLVDWQGHVVVVTGGVGSGSFPLRIGTRPDFWMITFTGR